MYIDSIRLENFRSYTLDDFTFVNGINVIEGANAVGKTNLVEAVYFCAVGKSPRTARDKELIRWDTEYAKVTVRSVNKYRSSKITALITKNGEKRIAIDGAGITRMGELIGRIGVVFFSPDELKLIKETPQERRRFMDISLSQQSRSYFYTLQNYTKILSNRNNLLKENYKQAYFEQTLPVWDIQLAKEGAEIVRKRREFIEFLSPLVDERHKMIAGLENGLKVEYETGVNGDDIENDLLKMLESSREKDIRLGFTTVGPHRDDMSITSNGIDLRNYGSQGQQRTAALALKLAEADCIELRTNERPILILDDVLSELDPYRRQELLKQAKKQQTLLTCTDYTENKDLIDNLIQLNRK